MQKYTGGILCIPFIRLTEPTEINMKHFNLLNENSGDGAIIQPLPNVAPIGGTNSGNGTHGGGCGSHEGGSPPEPGPGGP